MSNPDALLTLDQAAEIIPGADADTLKRRIRQGRLVAYRPGKSFLTTAADIQNMIERDQAGPLPVPNTTVERHARQKALLHECRSEFDECLVPIRDAGRALSREIGKPSVVYFIGFGPWVKIGYSAKLGRRMSDLDTLPGEIKLLLVCLGGLNEEKELHKRFADYHARNEWFWNEGELADFIARSQNA